MCDGSNFPGTLATREHWTKLNDDADVVRGSVGQTPGFGSVSTYLKRDQLIRTTVQSIRRTRRRAEAIREAGRLFFIITSNAGGLHYSKLLAIINRWGRGESDHCLSTSLIGKTGCPPGNRNGINTRRNPDWLCVLVKCACAPHASSQSQQSTWPAYCEESWEADRPGCVNTTRHKFLLKVLVTSYY
jgi:hypothetical protein